MSVWWVSWSCSLFQTKTDMFLNLENKALMLNKRAFTDFLDFRKRSNTNVLHAILLFVDKNIICPLLLVLNIITVLLLVKNILEYSSNVFIWYVYVLFLDRWTYRVKPVSFQSLGLTLSHRWKPELKSRGLVHKPESYNSTSDYYEVYKNVPYAL